MRGIDSNILIYALNKDLPEHPPCKELLEKIVKGEEIISIPAIGFMESFHALVRAYKYQESEVKLRLSAIIDSENVNVMEISVSTVLLAFEIAEKVKTGGRDSLIAASLIENNISEIYSHDADFDKITQLKRNDIIEN